MLRSYTYYFLRSGGFKDQMEFTFYSYTHFEQYFKADCDIFNNASSIALYNNNNHIYL